MHPFPLPALETKSNESYLESLKILLDLLKRNTGLFKERKTTFLNLFDAQITVFTVIVFGYRIW